MAKERISKAGAQLLVQQQIKIQQEYKKSLFKYEQFTLVL
jgi:hypothetical protein